MITSGYTIIYPGAMATSLFYLSGGQFFIFQPPKFTFYLSVGQSVLVFNSSGVCFVCLHWTSNGAPLTMDSWTNLCLRFPALKNIFLFSVTNTATKPQNFNGLLLTPGPWAKNWVPRFAQWVYWDFGYMYLRSIHRSCAGACAAVWQIFSWQHCSGLIFN